MPPMISGALFRFFEHLSNSQLEAAFEAFWVYQKSNSVKQSKYMAIMYDIYHDFEMRSVGEQSLTQIMMKTVRCCRSCRSRLW